MKILIIRFSAMGDVLLLYPVLCNLLKHNPDLEIQLLTRKKFSVFFEGIVRLQVLGVDLEQDYQGLGGLYRLFLLLRKQKFDAVADLHQNLRTQILKFFFRLVGVKCVGFEKGRTQKKLMTRKNHKKRLKLPHTQSRYLQTFQSFQLKYQEEDLFFLEKKPRTQSLQKFLDTEVLPLQDQKFWIGIAPFAQHDTKIWGIEKVKILLKLLQKDAKVMVFLFGGGQEEYQILQSLQEQFSGFVVNVAHKISLTDEIALIQQLKLMLCMDSSNMHLASLAGIPTISIWGATHPDVGFSPLYQSDNQTIQISVEDLPCRPCSVYGNQPCFRGDKACMNWIEPQEVYARLKYLLEHSA